MLRASSLGPILNLTYRNLRESCPYKLPAILSTSSRLNRLVHTRPEYQDARAPPPHVFSSAETTDQDLESAELSRKDVRGSPTQDALVREMLEREREGWKAEKEAKDIYVRQSLPYVTGKSHYSPPLPPLYGGKFKRGSSYKNLDTIPESVLFPSDYRLEANSEGEDTRIFTAIAFPDNISEEDLYYQLCHVLANTLNVENAWSAYSTILSISPQDRPRPRADPPIPFEHLHRLSRLLSQNLPKTRTQFLRLLSVLYTIRKHGGRIQQFEWNSLIANAGIGWRGSRSKDFELAFDIFEDMVSGNPPGSSFSPSNYPVADMPPQPVQPDIYTYNTLISIASKTLSSRTIARATAMLRSSGHSPDRITHLSLLVFFTHSRQLSGVRSTLSKMRQQNLEIGVDEINACMWAFGRSGKLELVKNIYSALRHNLYPEPEEVIGPILESMKNELIHISPLMRPNAITFSTVIQLMAWNGHLTLTYTVLMDMLSSLNLELGAPLVRDGEGEIHYTAYSAIYASFRSLFLGFSRHGVYLRTEDSSDFYQRKWTLSNLQVIFDSYIGLPDPIYPSKGMIYWIMVAFDRTSNHNVELMRKIWTQLEERFHGPWGGSHYRFHALRSMLFSEEARAYLRENGFRTGRRVSRSSLIYQYDQGSQ